LKGVKVAELTAACIDSYQRAFDGWLSRLWWEGRTWGRLVRDPWAQERIRLIAAALLRHGSLSGANISGLSLMATILAAVMTAQTWCWAADLYAPRTCVYTRQQCEKIVRLRRASTLASDERFHANR
jgi:hypothetical protein